MRILDVVYGTGSWTVRLTTLLPVTVTTPFQLIPSHTCTTKSVMPYCVKVVVSVG